MLLPQIVYLQTTTACNGHCRYCPHDDVYGDTINNMSFECYIKILQWLKVNNYQGRIGFLLHCEPTLDERLSYLVSLARMDLPKAKLEIATNCIKDHEVLKKFDRVDRVPAGSLKSTTSRAGNVKACPEIADRLILGPTPCSVPLESMCITTSGDVILCCQDWRHEAIVGTCDDLTDARNQQLALIPEVHNLELEICADCRAGKTAEEVGDRLGKRFACKSKVEPKPMVEFYPIADPVITCDESVNSTWEKAAFE